MTAVIARRGAARRIGLAVGVGLLMVTAGLFCMALSPLPGVAFGCTVVLGVGVSVCTGHLWPAYLQATPMDQLGRYQSLLVFAQMAALLIATVLFTAIAGRLGARWSLALCAACTLVTLIWWITSSQRRLGSPS
ncbi:hypothetical protein [Flexivirga alba]|uniref:MFS transporter n=1 Tax=Flexivirga alba TaxID=702742 RepID=A0ABW2AJK6_9MICO